MSETLQEHIETPESRDRVVRERTLANAFASIEMARQMDSEYEQIGRSPSPNSSDRFLVADWRFGVPCERSDITVTTESGRMSGYRILKPVGSEDLVWVEIRNPLLEEIEKGAHLEISPTHDHFVIESEVTFSAQKPEVVASSAGGLLYQTDEHLDMLALDMDTVTFNLQLDPYSRIPQ